MYDEYVAKLRVFADNYPLATLEKHQEVEFITSGKCQEDFYYIRSGFARYFLETKSGEILSYRLCSTNEIIPSILNVLPGVSGKHSPLSIECLTKMTVNRIPKDALLRFFLENEAVFNFKLGEAIIGTELALERIPSVVYGSVKEKLARFLIDLCSDYSLPKEGKLQIIVPLRHKDISSFIGATREVTTITLGLLRKLKIITYSKQSLTILDKKRLGEIADN